MRTCGWEGGTMKKFLLLGFGVLFLTGCSVHGHGPRVGLGVSMGGPPPVVVAPPAPGPPVWAPAHGRRAMGAHRYYYYPASDVYFNVSTGSYFYMNGGNWQMAMSLPSALVIDSGNYISLDLDTDRPYLFYDEHRVKYKGHKFKGNKHFKKHGKGHGHRGNRH